VEAIGRLGGDRAVALLDRAVLSPDLDIRRAALMGLGRMRRPGAFAGLLRAAASDDAETRLAAVLAIAQTSSPELIGALMRAGGDPDAHVRNAAFESLATQAGRDATRWLIDRLGIEADRSRAFSALAHQVDGRIEGILAALEVADATMSAWLVEVLLRMRGPNGGAAAEAVLQLENVEARRAAARALTQLTTAAARDAAAHAAKVDPDAEVRRICAWAL
jgi:HEAT repeat protein